MTPITELTMDNGQLTMVDAAFGRTDFLIGIGVY
jgi:hypothetical protein